jgi:hypothetical protein
MREPHVETGVSSGSGAEPVFHAEPVEAPERVRPTGSEGQGPTARQAEIVEQFREAQDLGQETAGNEPVADEEHHEPDVNEPDRMEELEPRAGERRYGPERINRPAPGRGRWSGVEGDSLWTPSNPAEYGLEPGQSILFRDGVPDLRQFVVDTPDGQEGLLEVAGLNGEWGHDSHLIDAYLGARVRMTPEAVAGWRAENGLTYHHFAGRQVQIVPQRIHAPLAHSGSASELRGGPTP